MKSNKISWISILPLIIFLFVSGCTHVRTYAVDKERVDQVLTEGNQGYLAGQPQEQPVRRLTRKTYVAEVEMKAPVSEMKQTVSSQGIEKSNAAGESITSVPQPLAAETASTTASVAKVTSYTVERNDTLQKISQKVYGTSKKWKLIYEANKDSLKSEDRIYAGQVLKIP